ncbi:hypothetical protein SCHPADRAFT_898128 [Schizopora paradoxa]|uniref:Uncharacterized protein n=1 Tax=Schizopora paradoxa TaxID=27342 RepID=A0A0H2S805_9AGAM|nr:hypothetical protein SCHPADRAFT_898128 [Schizopora paradoxa]
MDSLSLRNLLIILSTAVVAVVFQFHFDTWTFQHAANAIPSALTYLNATQKPRRYDAIRIFESYDKDPDTTVVILNWSRLENVKRIVKGHCNLPQQ